MALWSSTSCCFGSRLTYPPLLPSSSESSVWLFLLTLSCPAIGQNSFVINRWEQHAFTAYRRTIPQHTGENNLWKGWDFINFSSIHDEVLMSPVLCWSYPGIQSYSDFMSAIVITHPEDVFFQSIFLSSRSSFPSSPSMMFPECLSYFSTALIKYHDQGKLIEWQMYWPYCSRGMSPSPTHQENAAAEPGSSHLKLQAGKESRLGMEGGFHAQSSRSMTLHSARSHPLNYSNNAIWGPHL